MMINISGQRKVMRWFQSGVACLFCMAGAAWANTLQSFDVSALPGDRVEIRLGFTDVAPTPSSYTIETPARIALDLQGVSSSLKSKYFNLGNGNARTATVMSAGDRTRLIINLTQLVAYETVVDGNDMVVTIGAGGEAQAAMVAASGEKAVSAPKADADLSLRELDFRRGEAGEGQIIVTLPTSNVPVDLREEGGKIVAEFVGVSMPDELRRRLDVIDFATPVQFINAVEEEGNAVVSIDPEGFYEYLAYQTDELFTISVKPLSKNELERKKRDAFQFTGEKLSLNFQDIEVRSVLQLIADFTELNLVASDTVQGRITLRLQNVPWDQALDLILKTKGLDKRKVGNVMLVAPADEIAAREKLELEANRQVEELAPLRTEYMQVNYAKSSDLAALLTAENGFLSSRGSATVDERTNTILVQDTADKLENIRELLRELDIPVQQVLIESRLVVARADAAEEIGVQWGFIGVDVDGSTETYIGGSRQGVENNVEAFGEAEPAFQFGTETLAVDLGVAGAGASRFSMGLFKTDYGLLDLELSALESNGTASIVSTPKVLTADQQTARISSGTEIPYQEASSSGATTVSFKEAVLSLEVTPQITPDGRIIMDLKINQDSVGEIFFNIPSIDTNEIETSVLVDNGQTVVLGGIFRTEQIQTTSKTPFLGDVPGLGRFFRKEVQSHQKQELLIFITPRIVKGDLAQE